MTILSILNDPNVPYLAKMGYYLWWYLPLVGAMIAGVVLQLGLMLLLDGDDDPFPNILFFVALVLFGCACYYYPAIPR